MRPKTLKWIHQSKLQKFLTTYPYIFLCHHHGLSVSKWHQLRLQLQHISNTGFLVVKNTLVVDTFCQTLQLHPDECKSLFQGPSIAVGFSHHQDIQTLVTYFQSLSDVVVLAGIFQNQVFSFQEILKYQSLDHTVYTIFLETLQVSQNRLQLVQSMNFINLVNHPAHSLVTSIDHSLQAKTMLLLFMYKYTVNPTAGSPTVTLLRLRSSYCLYSGTLIL